MDTHFHQEAKKSYQKDIIEILKAISEVSFSPKPQIETEHYISAVITEKDIIKPIEYIKLTDTKGQIVSFEFAKNEKTYSLPEVSFKKLQSIADKIKKTKTIIDLISYDYIIDSIIEWIIENFQNIEYVDYFELLENKISSIVKEYEFWIPIPFTSISSEFKLGKIFYKTISVNIINSWFNPIIKKNTDEQKKNAIKESKLIFQKEFQGYCAGTIIIKAEKQKAVELAYTYLSESLSILRLITPPNFNFYLLSPLYEYGWNMYESNKYLIYELSKKNFTQASGIRDNNLRCHIDSLQIKKISTKPFSYFNDLILEIAPSDFQKSLKNAIMIYSKHTLRREPFDKVLYILVALESILLKNNTEPIQQSLADRIAFALSKDIGTRKHIVSLVKEIYTLRSGFVHHGKLDISDENTLFEFMNISFNMFLSLVENSKNYKRKEDCIGAIENIKYS